MKSHGVETESSIVKMEKFVIQMILVKQDGEMEVVMPHVSQSIPQFENVHQRIHSMES